MLNGRSDATYTASVSRINGRELAEAAFQHGKSNQIDPGHIALNFAHSSGNWGIGVAAAKILQGNNPLLQQLLTKLCGAVSTPTCCRLTLWNSLKNHRFCQRATLTATRRLLVDNDVLLKLARYGLLDALVNIFGIDVSDIQVLATAKYSLLPAKNILLRCKDADSANRLEDFLTRSVPLNPVDLDTNLLDTLSAIPSIDAGEALLLAAGASDPETLVITGDKRAVAALLRLLYFPSFERLSGPCGDPEIIFWQLVKRILPILNHAYSAKLDVDKAISNVFGVSAPATK